MKGIELFMNFEGQGYKTTLRAPNAGQTKRYVFGLDAMGGKEPGEVSVAPIFLEGGKDYVGRITSRLMIPYATIAIDIQELIWEIEASEDDFVIELEVDKLVQELICDSGKKPDPWGGCALAIGDLIEVTELFGKWAWASGELDGDWAGGHSVLFTHEGEGNSVCLTSNKTGCFYIESGKIDEEQGYINLGTNTELIVNNCIADKYYVYDSLSCE